MSPSTLLLLVSPPLLWASNAIVGRMAVGEIPPFTLNLLRWIVALLVLLPFAWRSCMEHRAALLAHWRELARIGFLGVTCFNALLYLALTTSSPINTSLILASSPIFILLIGLVFFHERIGKFTALGAVLSLLGVACVLLRGNVLQLGRFSFIPGDLYMLTAVFAWSTYTWLIKRSRLNLPAQVVLAGQICYGLLMALPFVVYELAWGGYEPVVWSARTLWLVVYAGIAPALIAYILWQRAVARTGAQLPVFFLNLTPIFTVGLSMLMLSEFPQAYHGAGLVLILAGIWLAQKR